MTHKAERSMENKGILTKVLAILGIVLVWLSLLAPVFFAIGGLFTKPGFPFQFDYLMPAELFPLVLVGGGLLLWAALRLRSRRKLIPWGLGSAVVLPLAGSVLAAVTGLADGRIEPGGWQSALVLAMLVGYILAVVVIGVGGVLLLRDLFSGNRPPRSTA